VPAEDAPKRSKKTRAPRRRRVVVEGLLGIGLDGKDGHTRITKGQDFFLVGGSEETHEKMQSFTIRLTERLAKKGKRIRDAGVKELKDLADDLTS
jgi:hypothetical protein